jgi:hypothetical protein
MENQLIITVFAGISALTAVVYTVVTARLLRTTSRSIDMTRRAVLLNGLMYQADLQLRLDEQNSDGSLRFRKSTVAEHMGRIARFAEEIEALA